MNKLNVIGLDLAKSVFHSVDQHGKRKKLRRHQMLRYFAQLPPSLIAMESCSSCHYWGREFESLGHQVLLLPPQHVKGYLRGQKNDFNDANAIMEAALHGRVRGSQLKTINQQEQQSLLRLRQQMVGERTRLVNQIRAQLFEYGIVLPEGVSHVRKKLLGIIDEADQPLSALAREMLHHQYQRLQRMDDDITFYTDLIEQQSKTNENSRRLATLPGFGAIISFAMSNWLGNGQQFKRGRDASAALGLVPRQHSSGDKTCLMGITKRGDGYLRGLLVHGARSVVNHAHKKTDPLSCWVTQLVNKRGFNKAVIALANKLVRIAWAVVARQESYQPAAAGT